MRQYLLLLKNELLPTPKCQCVAAMCSTHEHNAVLSATLVLVTHKHMLLVLWAICTA